MRSGFRPSAVFAAALSAAAAGLVIHADATPPSQAADVQLQLGTMLSAEGRYIEALEAFQNALKTTDTSLQRNARAGVITSALRVAEFDMARREAESLVKIAPRDAGALSLYGDALWASGLFEEAEARYKDALALQSDLPRGLHGMARSLLARNQLDDAMVQAQAALRLSPRDLEIHHTVGAIYERMHRFEEAAVAYGNYVNLLPNKDTSEKAAWSRAEIRFLRSFAQRVPFQADPGTDDMVFTVDFRTVNEKVVVRARVNDSGPQDLSSTPAPRTRSSPRSPRVGLASRRSRTRSARASARRDCAACSSLASTRSNSGRSNCATCPSSSRARRCAICRPAKPKACRRCRSATR